MTVGTVTVGTVTARIPTRGAGEAVTVAKTSPTGAGFRASPGAQPRLPVVRSDDPPGPVRRPPDQRLGWAARALLLIAAVVTVMLVALLIAMFVDDNRIDSAKGVATATVLSVSPLRTGIGFVDGSGLTIRPPGGVLYPGLLSVGQQFVVEYSITDPAIVRVAGRTAAVGVVMVLVAAAITWLIAGPLVWWLRRRAGTALLSTRPLRAHPARRPGASHPGTPVGR